VEHHPRWGAFEIAGFFGHEDRGLTDVLAPLTVDVLVGMGDDRVPGTEHQLYRDPEPGNDGSEHHDHDEHHVNSHEEQFAEENAG
jgi:hypothetical protein